MATTSDFGQWQPIAGAPRDGRRVLVVLRSSEQGGAEVDVARWGRAERGGEECWVASDSTYECPISYEEAELAFWMPLPSAMPTASVPDLKARAPQPPPIPEETGGSGI